MSRFNAILLAILSFGSSSLLMGMDLLPWCKKPSKNHYSSKQIEKLMLFRSCADLEGTQGKDNKSVPQEIKNIIVTNGYKLYCGELLEKLETKKLAAKTLAERDAQFEPFFQSADDKFKFTFMHRNNVNFMSMNDEGRDFFYQLAAGSDYFNEQAYNGIVKLPVGLKRMMRSSTVYFKEGIIDREAVVVYSLVSLGIVAGRIVSQTIPVVPALCTMAMGGYFGGVLGIVTGGIVSQTIPVVPSLCTVVIGGACGLLGCFKISDYAHIRSGNVRYVEKSIFTLEEQEIIKKENLELAKFCEPIEKIRFKQLPIELPNKLRSDFVSLRNLE